MASVAQHSKACYSFLKLIFVKALKTAANFVRMLVVLVVLKLG